MATIATDQEEELLIINDDSDDTADLELTLEEDSSVEEDVLTFDEEDTIKDSAPKINLSELKSKSEDEELNLDFDLWGEESEMTVEKMLGDKEEVVEEKVETENKEDDIFDFGLEEEVKEEESIIENKIEEVVEETEIDSGFDISLDDWDVSEEKVEEEVIATVSDSFSIWWDDGTTWDDDVNAILDITIAKLIKRKQQIEGVKEETIESIAKLNEEIKSLQTEVKIHKTEVKEFDKETSKISENVESLEKMKMV